MSDTRTEDEARLRRTLLLVGGFLIVELVGGFLANSLALISDAGHMFMDALALVLALVAFQQGHRPPDRKRTFGYRRLEILAALANGVLLLLVAFGIFREAWERFHEPAEVRSGLMFGVACLGLAVNLGGLYILRHGSRENLNMRGRCCMSPPMPWVRLPRSWRPL